MSRILCFKDSPTFYSLNAVSTETSRAVVRTNEEQVKREDTNATKGVMEAEGNTGQPSTG